MRYGWLLAIVWIALAGPRPASSGEPKFDPDLPTRLTARFQDFIDRGQIAGAVGLVATRDGTPHVVAVGMADRESARPMAADTIFRVASMTKPVTAVALMQLVEQGKVSVDDPVSKYIPAFKGQKTAAGDAVPNVTIRQVLTHTAGLAQPERGEFQDRSLEQICDGIGAKPLVFRPGSQWQYSSGLTVAGRIVEIVSGESFADYVQAHVCQPLGMVDTAFRLDAPRAARLAATYKPGKEKGSLVKVEIPDPTSSKSTPNPSGGLYSTAADMARFYEAILNGGEREGVRILKAETVRAMLADQTPTLVTGFTPGNGWALGWCHLKEPQGVTRHLMPGTYGHGGAHGTQGWTDPRRGLILVLMIQRTEFGNSDGSDVRDAFNETVLTSYRGAESEHARFHPFANYSGAVELTLGGAKAILCPEVGGRVLSFAVDGVESMYLEDREKEWKPGQPSPASAGRFDFGPELTVPQHPVLWSGPWTAEITGPHSARLTSRPDAASGIQLFRDFSLVQSDAKAPVRLLCRQTMVNISSEPREVCHWGRSFSPGGGVCLIPLAGQSRFPSRYTMYEESAIINVRNTDEKIHERDGFLEIVSPPRKPKLGFDSQAGWLAYVMPKGNLFVKRFAVSPDRVYNEAAGLTLSVWYPEGPRIELEPIGPRERLAAGEAASFAEEWSVHPFPAPEAGKPIDLPAVRKAAASLDEAVPVGAN